MTDADTKTPCLVITSYPNKESALQLAELLIQKQLAACVNLSSAMTSVYQWQGKLCREQEIMMLIKTTQTRYHELEQAILAHHPYELPEIIQVPIELGYAPYMGWIHEQVTSTHDTSST